MLTNKATVRLKKLPLVFFCIYAFILSLLLPATQVSQMLKNPDGMEEDTFSEGSTLSEVQFALLTDPSSNKEVIFPLFQTYSSLFKTALLFGKNNSIISSEYPQNDPEEEFFGLFSLLPKKRRFLFQNTWSDHLLKSLFKTFSKIFVYYTELKIVQKTLPFIRKIHLTGLSPKIQRSNIISKMHCTFLI